MGEVEQSPAPVPSSAPAGPRHCSGRLGEHLPGLGCSGGSGEELQGSPAVSTAQPGEMGHGARADRVTSSSAQARLYRAQPPLTGMLSSSSSLLSGVMDQGD